MPEPTAPDQLRREFKREIKKTLFQLLLLLFSVSLLLLVIALATSQNFIFPSSHSDQPSPKEFIDKKSAELSISPKPELIEHDSRDKPQVAITFDADMTEGMVLMTQRGLVQSWYNRPIKDTLDQGQVKATIFLTGLWVKLYPQAAADLAHDPLIEIGNHSFSHRGFTRNCYKLPYVDDGGDASDIQSAQTAIYAATGKVPKYFRFPGGCYDEVDLKTISRLGLKIVHWDVAAEDGFNNNTSSIVQNVLSRVRNGSIIVFHIHGGPYAPRTNDALIQIIPALKKRGYQFVTISEMLQS